MELTYTKVGDYYIPDLVLDEPEPVRTIGKYGSLRRSYLKQHRRSFYQELVISEAAPAQFLPGVGHQRQIAGPPYRH